MIKLSNRELKLRTVEATNKGPALMQTSTAQTNASSRYTVSPRAHTHKQIKKKAE